MSIAVVASTEQGLGTAVDEVSAPRDGIEAVIPSNVGIIYVKSNRVHCSPGAHTDPAHLEALLAY